MNLRNYFPLVALLTLMALSACGEQEKNEKEAVRKSTLAYVTAYNQHDPKAIAAFWAEDAQLANPESGEVLTGRSAIEAAFQERFKAGEDTHLEVQIGSITFPSEGQAVETGTFSITRAGQEIQASAFKTFFEKQNQVWLIKQTRQVDTTSAPNQYQHLKELEWLIGQWVDQDEDVEIETSYKWDKAKNFIYQKFSVSIEEQAQQEGTQIIGWDPQAKQIRSWIFDSDGGFGEATWTKQEHSWVEETAYTLADGERASAVYIFTPIDSDSYTWESTGREVDGKQLPDIEPLTVKRKKG